MPSRVVPHHTESHNRKRQQHLRSKVKNVYKEIIVFDFKYSRALENVHRIPE